MEDFTIGERVEIVTHEVPKYIGKTGIITHAQIGHHAIKGHKLTQTTIKVRLDEYGTTVTCFLPQLKKL